MRHGSPANRSTSPAQVRLTAARATARHTLVAMVALMLAACSAQIDRHGHHFSESEIRQITPGMTRDQVRAQLGTPDTTSTIGSGDAYYYIASTKKTVSFLNPQEIDRKVLAVYFNPLGAVDKVANYGLQDGKVINLVTRETPSHASEKTLFQQIFRNLGYKQIYGD